MSHSNRHVVSTVLLAFAMASVTLRCTENNDAASPRDGSADDASSSPAPPDGEAMALDSTVGDVVSADAGSEDPPDAPVGSSQANADAAGALEGGDSSPVVFIGLDSGLLGDGSCPGDVRQAFVAGTVTCAATDAVDAESTDICVPVERPPGKGDDQWVIGCKRGAGPLIQALDHFGLGAFNCSWLFASVCNAAGCCAPKGNFEYFVLGIARDTDRDTLPDFADNCPTIPNLNQADVDQDNVGDVCDDCPFTFDPQQMDSTDGGVGDACNCGLVPRPPLGLDGCPCADGGVSVPPDAAQVYGGDRCGLIVAADGGLFTLM